MIKTFVLDTNVLIHDNDAMFSFADNRVVIPISVIEELDNLKISHDEKGYNARTATRKLDRIFMSKKNITREVKINEGTIKIEFDHPWNLPAGFDMNKKDNLIIQTAAHLKEKGETVIFVSKDLNARIKAKSLGLEVQDYEKEKVKFDDLYRGYYEVQVSAEDIDDFYKKKILDLSRIPLPEQLENSYALIKSKDDENKSAIGRINKKMGVFQPLQYQGEDIWGIHALNVQQRFAFDLLLDDNISMVTLLGSAGTGKTLMAIAAALKRTLDDKAFKKILVARPIMPLGKDIGYLPGTKDEKLSAWMQPIFDNIYLLLTQNSNKNDISMRNVKEELDYLIDSNLIELGAITYIRGRSIPHQYVIIDEVQNLTPHEVKTIVSRIGEKSKIILTGDAEQIDNPYLDSDSNGLTYCVEKFKGQEIFGSIRLVKSERSQLASLAAQLL